MQDFRINNLKSLTRKIHKSQRKWRDKNWKKTLGKHGDEIEDILEKISVFNKWENRLKSYKVAKKLFPEIFIDAFSSVHFACFGFYKYANMCLRSELETTLRLVFFSTHPVEFKWWLEGNMVYKNILNPAKDVWGQGFLYFENLENIQKFERNCDDSKKIFSAKKIKNLYNFLSQFIHTSAGHFQSRPGKFSPVYDLKEFRNWLNRCKEVQTYINILLTLSFSDVFKNMSENSINVILTKGVGDEYKNIIKKTLNL
ncbi:MAG: hypothetical protein ACTSRS_21760 [Candidatus Helarchaeota archaeon]